jgi:hypothetical protein
MPKRFLDTGFLEQKWIRHLSPDKKIFLIYLMLKCDNAGIIELDLEDASFWIGKKIEDISFLPEGYLIPINGTGKYFMPKFIEWQYPDLSSNKHIVAQARQLLEKYGLIDVNFNLSLDKLYIKVTETLPENQVTGIGKGKGIGKEGGVGETKKEIDYSFVPDEWQPIFQRWVAYKKSRKEHYKTQETINACYRNLLDLSNNDLIQASKIVDQSMGNNWAGLFPLKDVKRNSTDAKKVSSDFVPPVKILTPNSI